jgi:hypothetical protein
MGSISCDRPKGLSDKEFFQQEYPWMEVIDCVRVGGVVYLAGRKLPELCSADDDATAVFALVFPCETRGGHFWWKEQDETFGPYDTRCPDRILDRLTETDNENAKDWRAQCRASNAQELAARDRAKAVAPGTIIRLAEPIEFTSGAIYDTFKFIERSTFWAMNSAGAFLVTVTIPRWKSRAYEIISARS